MITTGIMQSCKVGNASPFQERVMHYGSWNAGAREASNSLPSKEVMNHQHWKNEWCITVADIKACALV